MVVRLSACSSNGERRPGHRLLRRTGLDALETVGLQLQHPGIDAQRLGQGAQQTLLLRLDLPIRAGDAEGRFEDQFAGLVIELRKIPAQLAEQQQKGIGDALAAGGDLGRQGLRFRLQGGRTAPARPTSPSGSAPRQQPAA